MRVLSALRKMGERVAGAVALLALFAAVRPGHAFTSGGGTTDESLLTGGDVQVSGAVVAVDIDEEEPRPGPE